jgi:PadR family transcriptional regulator, regulatory protein PadR
MTRVRRPSAQTTVVVLALADKPTAWRYGYELCQQLDLTPGSLYPILMWLANGACWRPPGTPTSPPAGRPATSIG